MADESITLYAKIGAAAAAAWATYKGAKKVLAARVQDQGDDIETLRGKLESLQQIVEDLKHTSKEKIDSMRVELSAVKLGVQEMQYEVQSQIRDSSRQAHRHLNAMEEQLRELRALFEVDQAPVRELPRD
jgi:chromosome segregation ATPase